MMKRFFLQVIIVSITMLCLSNTTYAQSINVPNYSFESPETVFVDTAIASWQKSDQPFWYDAGMGGAWEQLTGAFLNLDPNDPNHIDNCDGNQAAWLFAVPEVSLYQDLNDVFEPGYCYDLGFGVFGGNGGMRDGVGIEIRLYYRDINDNKVIIDSTEYIYDANDGVVKHFNDVWVTLPVVDETDAWAYQNIGIEIISTLTLADLDPVTGRAGGYWDIDNVRLNQHLPSPVIPLDVPNYSFELPETVFVDTAIASWQKSDQPFWYDAGMGGAWEQLTGAFLNLDPNDPNHIDNCDGNQAAWLFAVPEVSLYQDLNDVFEPGYCYDLGFGVFGGNGGMRDGVGIEIRLYYRDINDTKVTIDSQEYIYDANDGVVKHFNDVWVTLSSVQETDPWAYQNIGIEIISTLTLADLDPVTGRAGGYWDIDNVRLNQHLPSPVVPLDVPNYSFESPETVFVDTMIDSWQKSDQPFWYDASMGGAWEQLTGVFLTLDPNDPNYIDNMDSNQAAWLFAVPGVSLYQDLNDVFEPGQSYALGFGVFGGGGGMKHSVPIELRLYYRDVNDTKVIIDSTEYIYDANDGVIKHFNDVWVTLPEVQETDAWSYQNIGLEIISTLTLADLDPETGRAGGYWDIDNVRLITSDSEMDCKNECLNLTP